MSADRDRCDLCNEPCGYSGHRTSLGFVRCNPLALKRAREQRTVRGIAEPELDVEPRAGIIATGDRWGGW